MKWEDYVQSTLNNASNLEFINFSSNNSYDVSVVVPVYNVENTLPECIDSLVSQTHKSIEIICVDDGSTDSSLSILKHYASLHDNVKIITKSNRGYGHSMNIGVDYASGKYIGIVESDDFVDSDMFATLYDVASSNNLDFVKSDFSRFHGEKGSYQFQHINVVWKKYYDIVLSPRSKPEVSKMNMQTWTGLYKRSFLVDNNIRHNETPGASFQDNGFYLKTYLAADRVMFLNKSLYRYRIDNPNSSVHNREKVYVIKDEFDLIEQYYLENNLFDDYHQSLFFWKKYKSYMFTIDRVGDEFKKEFIMFFSKEFGTLIENGIVKKTFFSPEEWSVLNHIVTNPQNYYEYRFGDILVSIIVPCYNSSLNIIECLDSIKKQSLSNIEIICINDGSSDNTIEILEDYKSREPRLQILKHNKNIGVGKSRNEGILKSKGHYIAFMDSDDYYPDLTILEKLYNKARDNNALVCGGSFSELYDGKIITKYDGSMAGYTFENEGWITFEDYQFDFGFHRFLYNREMIITEKIMFPDYKRYQDPPFFVSALSAAKQIYVIPDVVYRYRRGHTVSWNSQKVIDLNKGLTDVILFSNKNGYYGLFHTTVDRFEKRYWKQNLDFYYPDNKELILSLDYLNEAINAGNKESMTVNDDHIWKLMMKKMYLEKEKANNQKISDIEQSFSYKLGRFLTFVPRKIINIFNKT